MPGMDPTLRHCHPAFAPCEANEGQAPGIWDCSNSGLGAGAICCNTNCPHPVHCPGTHPVCTSATLCRDNGSNCGNNGQCISGFCYDGTCHACPNNGTTWCPVLNDCVTPRDCCLANPANPKYPHCCMGGSVWCPVNNACNFPANCIGCAFGTCALGSPAGYIGAGPFGHGGSATCTMPGGAIGTCVVPDVCGNGVATTHISALGPAGFKGCEPTAPSNTCLGITTNPWIPQSGVCGATLGFSGTAACQCWPVDPCLVGEYLCGTICLDVMLPCGGGPGPNGGPACNPVDDCYFAGNECPAGATAVDGFHRCLGHLSTNVNCNANADCNAATERCNMTTGKCEAIAETPMIGGAGYIYARAGCVTGIGLMCGVDSSGCNRCCRKLDAAVFEYQTKADCEVAADANAQCHAADLAPSSFDIAAGPGAPGDPGVGCFSTPYVCSCVSIGKRCDPANGAMFPAAYQLEIHVDPAQTMRVDNLRCCGNGTMENVGGGQEQCDLSDIALARGGCPAFSTCNATCTCDSCPALNTARFEDEIDCEAAKNNAAVNPSCAPGGTAYQVVNVGGINHCQLLHVTCSCEEVHQCWGNAAGFIGQSQWQIAANTTPAAMMYVDRLRCCGDGAITTFEDGAESCDPASNQNNHGCPAGFNCWPDCICQLAPPPVFNIQQVVWSG